MHHACMTAAVYAHILLYNHAKYVWVMVLHYCVVVVTQLVVTHPLQREL